MVSEGPAEVLHGRRVEREALERLLEAVRRGQSRVLVVSGEPGVGKTALLESAIGSASGFRVARAVGVESEMELAFAALQQLCAPLLDRLDRLPAPQRDALQVAFGSRAGDAPDRFLVGLAVLSLLAEVAEEQPFLCVIDDAQWLDRASAQALVFVARRLLAESVALVLVTREPGDELQGFQELAVKGLPDGDARALLSSAVRVPLDAGVRDRLVAETRGNPLALLELPRGLTPAELAGGFGLLDAPGLSGRIEDSFRRRLAGLPADTQRLLLVAAAEPVGDPVLVWRAADRLGIAVTAASETDGLLAIDARVTFRHPLVRSAVYRAASPDQRRAAHRALADATDPEVDPDRRAWHLAQATPRFDEDVASELERSAGRAQARGGLAAAAAFLERAAVLTPEPSHRAARALAAAQAKHQAGAFDSALRLVNIAESGPLNELQRARVDLLRGQIAFSLGRGGDAQPLLLKAAKRLEPLDQRLARDTYLEALTAVFFPGILASDESVLETARAARSAPRSSQPPQASDLLLDGLGLLITEGYAAGTPTLRMAVNAFRDEDVSRGDGRRWLSLASRVAALLWDDETWDVLSARFVQLARDAGALSGFPLALATRSAMHLFAGEFALASSLLEEVAAVNEVTGASLAPYVGLAHVAFHGREAEAAQLIEATTREVVRRGEGQGGLTFIHWVTAVLDNGLGRYEEALAAAQQAAEDTHASWWRHWGSVELIEAAARSGKAELAVDALAQLSKTTGASGTDWALGVEARSRALLTEGDAAESLYREAIQRLERTRVRVELARAHLVYGEWLRRKRRRLDAREQLRTAHERFTEFGMEAFAARARVELEATGEHARKRSVETRDDLTPQEAQIARLAAGGATNQEIAAQLFISPSTVDYHLRKTFRKLGIKSRHQLKQHSLQPGAHTD
ncbi:AAA family ATPase [Solirubrobacter ginsenosidimutans]|uniref:AAA family ATPase n=1 Tax=Solirubrobacter ginsenosidimutans TaxID=490573 RepID=A0A9X3MVL5_9ACTN|nr:helix-turn-helix transcriptional regulator [Solirubrobacter ginsenosidimutans]MDA0160763.1 AAA family ATPase [Solirubrobacter ginsenosidimutans]